MNINPNYWKTAELESLDALLDALPQTHTQANPALSAVVRSEALTHQDNNYPSISGIYRREVGQIALYNSAFEEKIDFDRIALPCLDLTLYTLIGFSLFEQETLRDPFATTHYPEFDQGLFNSLEIFLFDREIIHKELHISPHQLVVPAGMVSLDRSFGLFYACYVLLPNLLANSRPQTYRFFKETIFDGREYKNSGSEKKQSKVLC